MFQFFCRVGSGNKYVGSQLGSESSGFYLCLDPVLIPIWIRFLYGSGSGFYSDLDPIFIRPGFYSDLEPVFIRIWILVLFRSGSDFYSDLDPGFIRILIRFLFDPVFIRILIRFLFDPVFIRTWIRFFFRIWIQFFLLMSGSALNPDPYFWRFLCIVLCSQQTHATLD